MHTPAEQPSDTHYEIALDDESEAGTPDRKPVYVDVTVREHELRPVVPASLRPANLPTTARRAVERTGHRVAYHGVRLPKYLLFTLGYALWGLVRLMGRQVKWAWVMEQNPLREETIRRLDVEQWIKLFHLLGPVRKRRLLLLCAEVPAVVCAVAVLVWFCPPWVGVCVAVLCTVGLAWFGQPAGKPILTAAVVTPRLRKLSADIVLRAYYAAGLGHPTKADQQIKFASTMARDPNNVGSQVVIDVPYGTTFSDVMGRKEKLASGLDVSEYQVFLTKDHTSNRRHQLFVADVNPLGIPAGRTPLLKLQPTDIWTPAPLGKDERNRHIGVDLMWNSLLVGSLPRVGKTWTARQLALFAALDPYVKISLADGKALPDWRGFTQVADRTVFGLLMTRNGDPVDALIDMLREIKKDAQQRAEHLSSLPVDVCPEGKLTREISRDPRYGMPVRVLVVEEFQEYLETSDKAANIEIAELLLFMVKVAPASGVITISATQKPSGIGTGDVAKMATTFRDQHQLRFALRCANYEVSRAVLGGDAYAEGYDASKLPKGPQFRGVGILYGQSDDVPTVRGYLADGRDADKILKTARRFREQAGTLTGEAAGHTSDVQRRDPLSDVRGVYYAGEVFVSWKAIASRLAQRYPEAYAEITAEAISAQIRGLGVRSVDGKYEGATLKGAKIAHIDEAIKRREIEGQ